MLNKAISTIIFYLSIFLLFSINGNPETIVEKSFKSLRENPPLCSEQFHFIVVGDTQPGEPHEFSPFFFRMIDEWNILKPPFVISLGDLILGGAVEGLDSQWSEFENIIAKLHIPFFPAPGNHDISDKASEEIYKQRMGPVCYAFTYGNARFIFLDTEEPGQVDTFSDIQIEWLKKELAKVKEKHLFVFFHKPYFVDPKHPGWSTIESLLQPFPSVFVFAGHDHRYLNVGRRGNIQYAISGGGGGPIRTDPEEGGFHHYLWVQVNGNTVSWSVIKPGNIEPIDIVSKEKIDLRNLWKSSIQIHPIEWEWGSPIQIEIPMQINNLTDEAAMVKILWDIPSPWNLSFPCNEFQLAGRQSVSPMIKINRDTGLPKLYPVPKAKVIVNQNSSTLSFDLPFPIYPSISIPYIHNKPSIDGDLIEWQNIPEYPLLYPIRFDPEQNTQDLQASLKCAWNEDGIYMAVQVYDNEFYQPFAGDIVWCADNLELFLGEWEWSLTRTAKGPEVFLYVGPGREEETVNNIVQLAVIRKDPYTYYEVHFPPSELTPIKLQAGSKTTFSLIANDLDTSGEKPIRHWLEFMPDTGSGSDDFPRTIFVLKAPNESFFKQDCR